MSLSSALIHPIIRDSNEQYLLVVYGGESPAAKVFDLEGNEQPLTVEADLSYLAAANQRSTLKALTVADYTFLLNTEVTVEASSEVSPSRRPEALLFVRQVSRGADYRVRVYNSPTSAVPSYTAELLSVDTNPDRELNDGEASGDPIAEDQGSVRAQLQSALTSAGLTADYWIQADGPMLWIQRKDNQDFRVEVECSIPDGFYGFKDRTQDFARLPRKGFNNFHLEVVGSPEQSGDEYYLRFESGTPSVTDDGFAEGSWVETIGQGVSLGLDASTMPLTLISDGSGFVLKAVDWEPRRVGDDDTNPHPSFVGSQISDIFFHRGRLGFLSDENVIYSQVSGFFNFYRETVRNLLDSDAIDVQASSTKVAKLQWAVPASETITLWSDQVQFVEGRTDLLTPETASFKPVTDEVCTLNARPASVGSSIFYPFTRGDFSGVAEYVVEPDTGLFRSLDVSDHVPRYLAGEVLNIAAMRAEGILLVQTTGYRGLYVYKWHDSRNDRVQSAWYQFDFGANARVRSVFFFGSRAYLVLERSGEGTFLEYMDLQSGLRDEYGSWVCRLDRRVDHSGVSNYSEDEENDTLSFDLPYTPSDPSRLRVVRTRNSPLVDGLSLLRVLSVEGNRVTIRNPLPATYNPVPGFPFPWPLTFFVGELYNASFVLTQPTLRERGEGSVSSVNTGRWQIRRGHLSFNDSVGFSVSVAPDYRKAFTYVFKPRNINQGNSTIGTLPELQDGVFEFPVYSQGREVTITLTNDTPFTSNLLSLDWIGTYTPKGRRF